ncbi:MAG: amidase, partial [Betaproteobacteria bacterium]|nr:amidase [Betaproteobacteria bacterium]
GSAAAVAAGMVPAALGTQTNGSVVRPAAFCGVVGYKPSRGAIATRGMLEFSRTLDQPGVLARSVADCALFAACIVDTAGAVAASVASLAAPPRLVAVRSPVWHLAQSAQREMFARNLEQLRAEGAEVAEVELPPEFERAHAAHRTIMACEAARSLGDVQRVHRMLISPRLNAFLDEGAAVPELRYRDALALQKELEAGFARFLAGADAVVTPPATGEAPATLEETGDPAFCTIWTLVGAPVVTIPVGRGP